MGFIILGMAVGHGDWSHFTSPAVRTSTTPIMAQFLVSLLWVMVEYRGWNTATYIAGEVKEPERPFCIFESARAIYVFGLVCGQQSARILFDMAVHDAASVKVGTRDVFLLDLALAQPVF